MEYKACFVLAFVHFHLILSKGQVGNNKQVVVKSIKSKDGDIFDCIDIMSQPTFQDPWFKNHTIQMKPSSFPGSINVEAAPNITNLQSEVYAVPCPSGTIPIWRNQRTNISSFYSKDKLEHILLKNKSPYKRNDNRRIHVAYFAAREVFFGASAILNVYKPDVKVGTEERLSGVSIFATPYFLDRNFLAAESDFIEAGWFVRPSVSGDNEVRIHIFWHDSTRRRECINLSCSGFVQVATDFALGSRLSPASIYEGSQFEITVHIYKDFRTGNWWLAWGKEKKPIGYWERSVINHIEDGIRVYWGGMVMSPPREDSPPMGSGHWPSEGFGRAAYVKDPKCLNKNNNFVSLHWRGIAEIRDARKCYAITWPRNMLLDFYLGGPAGCKN